MYSNHLVPLIAEVLSFIVKKSQDGSVIFSGMDYYSEDDNPYLLFRLLDGGDSFYHIIIHPDHVVPGQLHGNVKKPLYRMVHPLYGHPKHMELAPTHGFNLEKLFEDTWNQWCPPDTEDVPAD